MTFPQSVDTQENLFLAKNQSQSNLAAVLTAAATQITVTSGTSFPSGRQIVSVRNELIIVSSVTGVTLTVEQRGAFGTTAVQHPAGTLIAGNFTAEHWNTITATMVAAEGELFFYRRPVISANEMTPPATPAEGDQYLIPTGAAAPWDTHAGELASWNGTAWDYTVPEEGMQVFDKDTQTLRLFKTTGWVNAGAPASTDVSYDNTASGASATDVKGALDSIFSATSAFEIAASFGTKFKQAEVLVDYVTTRKFTIPTNFTDSLTVVTATPAIDVDFDFAHNGTSFGTLNIVSNIGTFTSAADEEFDVGDLLTITPSTDAEFTSIALVIKAIKPIP